MSPSLRKRLPLPSRRLRQVQEHRLELNPDEVHVADPQPRELVRRETPIAVERIQDEALLVAREHVVVVKARRLYRPRVEMELHAHVPSEQTSKLCEICAVRLVQDDSHSTTGGL